MSLNIFKERLFSVINIMAITFIFQDSRAVDSRLFKSISEDHVKLKHAQCGVHFCPCLPVASFVVHLSLSSDPNEAFNTFGLTGGPQRDIDTIVAVTQQLLDVTLTQSECSEPPKPGLCDWTEQVWPNLKPLYFVISQFLWSSSWPGSHRWRAERWKCLVTFSAGRTDLSNLIVTPPSTHTHTHTKSYSDWFIWGLVRCLKGCIPGGLWFLLRNTDFIPFNCAWWKKKVPRYIKHAFCSHTCVWQGARDSGGRAAQKELLLLGVAPSCRSLLRSLVSHNAVSFLLEVPAQKMYPALKPLHIPAQAPAAFEDLSFLPEAFPRKQKTLEIQLQVAKKQSVYVLEHLKYNTSPLEGRGNFIECSILNVVVLNTARGITHSARTWECVKDCSLWMSPLNGPLRSSHYAHVNTVQLVPSKETKACKVDGGFVVKNIFIEEWCFKNEHVCMLGPSFEGVRIIIVIFFLHSELLKKKGWISSVPPQRHTYEDRENTAQPLALRWWKCVN